MEQWLYPKWKIYMKICATVLVSVHLLHFIDPMKWFYEVCAPSIRNKMNFSLALKFDTIWRWKHYFNRNKFLCIVVFCVHLQNEHFSDICFDDPMSLADCQYNLMLLKWAATFLFNLFVMFSSVWKRFMWELCLSVLSYESVHPSIYLFISLSLYTWICEATE